MDVMLGINHFAFYKFLGFHTRLLSADNVEKKLF